MSRRNISYHGHSKKTCDHNFKRMKSDSFYHGLRKSDKYKSWKNSF